MDRHAKRAGQAAQAVHEETREEAESRRRRISVFAEGEGNWEEKGAGEAHMSEAQREQSEALFHNRERRQSLPGQLPPSMAHKVPPFMLGVVGDTRSVLALGWSPLEGGACEVM